MGDKKTKKVATECITEMFRRVGLPYPCPEITSQENWYWLREWTVDEEEDFKKWMLKKVKKELRLTDHGAKLQVCHFLGDVGWKTKEEPKKESEDNTNKK